MQLNNSYELFAHNTQHTHNILQSKFNLIKIANPLTSGAF